VFEPEGRLRKDVLGLLDALRSLAGGRYAVVFETKGVVLESPASGDGALRRFVESHARSLLEIPAALHSGGEMTDQFSEWEGEAFFLAFVNGKVGVLTDCDRLEHVEQEAGPLLKALADRLLRLNPAWRVDERGRGFFGGRPRLDTVVIGRAQDETA
jgi:hypothetical protein